MKAMTSNWLLSADYDIKTASSLLKNKRFIKEFDKAIAGEYLKRTREIIKWLKKNILKLKSKK